MQGKRRSSPSPRSVYPGNPGAIESAVTEGKVKIRSVKSDLENNLNTQIDRRHPILAWLRTCVTGFMSGIVLAKTVAQLNGDEHEEIGRRLACQLGEKVFHSRGNAPRPQGKPWVRIGRFMEKGWRVGHNARTGAILVMTEQGVM